MCSSDHKGGAIYLLILQAGSFTLSSPTFESCHAQYGGALAVEFFAKPELFELNSLGLHLNSNNVTDYGASFFAYIASSSYVLEDYFILLITPYEDLNEESYITSDYQSFTTIASFFGYTSSPDMFSSDLYISPLGTDNLTCGLSTCPCLTLAFLLHTSTYTITYPNQVWLMDGAHTSEVAPIYVNNNLRQL